MNEMNKRERTREKTFITVDQVLLGCHDRIANHLLLGRGDHNGHETQSIRSVLWVSASAFGLPSWRWRISAPTDTIWSVIIKHFPHFLSYLISIKWENVRKSYVMTGLCLKKTWIVGHQPQLIIIWAHNVITFSLIQRSKISFFFYDRPFFSFL